MSIHLQLLRSGTGKAVKTALLLLKIILPVTLVVVTLEKYELLLPVAAWFSPALEPFGLPGEASLPLLLGFFVNIYAAIGAIIVLPLSNREITVMSIMILTSHSLLVEGPILKFTGLSPFVSIPIRIAAALAFGYLVNLAYQILGG